MDSKRRDSVYPKLALLCLSIILVLTLSLFGVGLLALSDKHDEVVGLEQSNVQLKGERVAVEFVREVWQRAEDGLNAPSFLRLEESAHQTSLSTREVLALQEDIRKKHPIVQQVFLLTPTRLITPGYLDRQQSQDLRNIVRTQPALRTTHNVASTGVVSSGVRFRQVFYRAGTEPGSVVGFFADQAWLSQKVLPEAARAVSFDAETAGRIHLAQRSLEKDDERPSVSVPLLGVFPFLHIDIPKSGIELQKSKAKRETAYLIVSCAMFVAVLGVAVVLIVRLIRDQQAKQLRTDFLSAFSHELKTPLTLIRLYSETLQQDDHLTADSRATYYQIITRESERLSKLLERLLAARKIEKGQTQYRLEMGDLSPVIRETVEAYAEHLMIRGFDVKLELADNLPVSLFDAEALSQAVLNLMDNARKYSGEKKYMRVAMFEAGKNIMIEVEDHGTGIPAEERDKIFEGFYRGSDAASRQGFGLGLYLVRHIMTAHKGRIDVQSQVGVGSTFRLVIPLARAKRLSLPESLASVVRKIWQPSTGQRAA